jgi:hypothetical protein
VTRRLSKARFEQRQLLLCILMVGLFIVPADSARKSRAARNAARQGKMKTF